ncbi:MAG: hypothetical protein ACREXP_16475 [Steroidobacteraceae bacterium]
MSEPLTRLTLWFAALVLGIHIGAAVYEMMVVTPLWAGAPPQSVRGFNPVAEFAIRPLTYKLPAIAVLAFASFALLSVAMGKATGRGWTLLAGGLGLVLVIATVGYAFPILRRTIVANGAGLTDAEIVQQVHAWIFWSRVRLTILIVAWTAVIVGLVQRTARSQRRFSSDLRWK